MRAWAAETAAAEAAYVAARGRCVAGTPKEQVVPSRDCRSDLVPPLSPPFCSPSPRSLQRKRGLAFISRYDSMIEGLRSVSRTHVVHSACVILGANHHNPRHCIVVDFAAATGDATAGGAGSAGTDGSPPRMHFPLRYPLSVARILSGDDGAAAAVAEWTCKGGTGEGAAPPPPLPPAAPMADDEEDDEDHVEGEASATDGGDETETDRERRGASARLPALPPSSSSAAAVPPSSSPPVFLPSPSSYLAPLADDLVGAVARKAARLFVLQAAALYGMSRVPPNKVLVLLRTSPLGGARGDPSAMPDGWHMRPAFALKPPRQHQVRTVSFVPPSRDDEEEEEGEEEGEEAPLPRKRIVVWGKAEKYRLVGVAVTGTEDGTTIPGEEARWWQWVASPKGVKGTLPAPVELPAGKRGGGASIAH
jgi:hypothetical protein